MNEAYIAVSTDIMLLLRLVFARKPSVSDLHSGWVSARRIYYRNRVCSPSLAMYGSLMHYFIRTTVSNTTLDGKIIDTARYQNEGVCITVARLSGICRELFIADVRLKVLIYQAFCPEVHLTPLCSGAQDLVSI